MLRWIIITTLALPLIACDGNDLTSDDGPVSPKGGNGIEPGTGAEPGDGQSDGPATPATVDELLAQLEQAGRDSPAIQADIDYHVDQRLTGDSEHRTGSVKYQAATDDDSAKFYVGFDTLALGGGPAMNDNVEEYAFVTGKISMTIEGAWEFRNYNRAKHLWDIAMVPLQHKTSKRTKAGGGVAHVIYSGAKHPDAAWKLVRFLSGERSQRALGRSGTSIPVLKSAAFSEDFLAPFDRPARSSHKVIWDNLGRSEFVPRFSRGYLEYMKLTRQLMQEVWLGSKTPLEACEIVDKEVNEILREQYGDL